MNQTMPTDTERRTRAELLTADPGLYLVTEDDGTPIQVVSEAYDVEDDAVHANAQLVLYGRVRPPGKPQPIGVESFTVRDDGLEVVTSFMFERGPK